MCSLLSPFVLMGLMIAKVLILASHLKGRVYNLLPPSF